MSYVDELLKLAAVERLSTRPVMGLEELAMELGLGVAEARLLVGALSRNFAIELRGDNVYWSPADNLRHARPWGWGVLYGVVLGSTLMSAKLARPWTLAVAEMQRDGRGRLGKQRGGALGGLWATFKLRARASALPLALMGGAYALSLAIERGAGARCSIGWPNDVVVEGRKVGEVFVEGEVVGGEAVVYVTVEVNANNDAEVPGSASLKEVLGSLVPRGRLLGYLATYLARLEAMASRPEELRRGYASRLETLGRKVVARTVSGDVVGVAKGVDARGNLIVDTGSGERVVEIGDVVSLRHVD
ncbi:MAG: biotin--[acetyl-CoA-carboxylase] ligase [Desulfurococcaceae archaeon]